MHRPTRRDFLALAGLPLVTARADRFATGDPAGMPGLDLRGETGRVRHELAVFRDRYLPRLLAGRALAYHERGARLIELPSDPARLRAWQAAVDRLAAALPGSRPRNRDEALDPAALRRYVFSLLNIFSIGLKSGL
ncbi:MAG: hypothetical protein LC745_10740 [Planctomycetia bacterium]|nr:hypothetical protein [Planctomycetia bacterium]